MIQIHYKDDTGDYMVALGVREIDLKAPYMAKVHKVVHGAKTRTGEAARAYVVALVSQKLRIAIGRRKNLLLRYKDISDEFDKYTQRDIPITKTYRRYILPKFHISRDTLYKIFNTDIQGELKALDTQIKELDKL